MKIENIDPGVHASFQKVSDENKRKKKIDCCAKNICERMDFIRLYQKIGWADFDELRVNDSEGTNSQGMSELGWNRWFVVRSHTMSTIKLAMADTLEWWRLRISSIVGLLILYGKNILGQ